MICKFFSLRLVSSHGHVFSVTYIFVRRPLQESILVVCLRDAAAWCPRFGRFSFFIIGRWEYVLSGAPKSGMLIL